MTTLDIGAIRKKAGEQLACASYDPKKLALIYAGAALGVSLVIAVLDLALLRSIGNTSGLSGLGMRAVLETIREVLNTALNFALPFWSFGFLHTALAMARGGNNRPEGLLEGFRRFGAVLRLQLQRSLLFVGIALVCLYVGAFLFYASPLAAGLLALLEPVLTESATIEQVEAFLAQLPMDQLMGYVWPALAMGGGLCVLILVPLHYRLRLADFFVMDEPKMLPMVAMVTSSRHMRKNRLQWFRLELSYWWYYAGLVLAALVCYGNVLLPLIGVELPVSGDMAWLLFYVLGALVQFLLDWQNRSRMQTTYALAYDILRQQEPETEKPAPKKLPWDEYPAQEE